MQNSSTILAAMQHDIVASLNTNTIVIQDALPVVDVERRQPWNEFATGMSCLANHAHQSRANYSEIVKANTLLLYSNLKRNQHYKRNLKELEYSRKFNSMRYFTRPIIVDQQVKAEFICLQPSMPLTDLANIGSGPIDQSQPTTRIMFIIKGTLYVRKTTASSIGVLHKKDILILESGLHPSTIQVSTQKTTAVLINIHLDSSSQ